MSHIWLVGADRNAHENVMPATKDDDVDASLVAARASQRKETSGPLTVPHRDENGQVSADTSCSVRDMKSWLKEIRERVGPDKRKVLNDSQFEVVKKVAERVCAEMDVLVTGDYDSLPEPLRWSMHGGPGTGKTHVINIIEE